jgi:TRAP-type C4-dicarboxylate transport system permease small subunit
MLDSKYVHDANGVQMMPPHGSIRKTADHYLDRIMRFEVLVARMESRIALASWIVAVLAILASLAIRTLSLPIPDTGEWALVAMSPLTFIGGALCSHLRRHLTADIVEMLSRGPMLQILEAVSALLFIIFGVFFVALSMELFNYAVTSRERLTDLGTPIAIPVGCMLLGAGLMIFHAVLDFIRACLGREPGGYAPW